MYQVTLGNKSKKFFKGQDEKTREKLRSVFETLEKNPWPAKDYDLSKIAGMSDCYRIKLGKLRVLYHVESDSSEIVVYRIERKTDSTYNR